MSACNTDSGKIKISGIIEGYQDSTRVILKNLDTQKVVDTTFIINNQFSLYLLKTDPTPHGLFIGRDYDYLFIWLENANITINGTKAKIRDATIKAGKVQNQTNNLYSISRPLSLLFDSINEENRKAYEVNDLEKARSLEKQLDNIIHERIVLGAKYVMENPDNLLSAFALAGYIPGLPKSEIELLYKNLSPEIKESRYAKSVSAFLEQSKEVKIGDMAEYFQLPDLNGNQVGLKDYKGKYVLLDFWEAGCASCRIENRNLIKIYKKYKSKDFEIVSVSVDRNTDNWVSASKQDSIIWASLLGNGIVGHKYNVKYLPSNFLIDPSGRIIAINLRGEKVEEKLMEIFN